MHGILFGSAGSSRLVRPVHRCILTKRQAEGDIDRLDTRINRSFTETVAKSRREIEPADTCVISGEGFSRRVFACSKYEW